ncbi:MAG: ABC transporter ATP-binding protein/permease [Gemmatimonadota bacterium]|nr:ABC transporter ATP-binding protein/permease [Gemmatimonadota bacterium]
MSDVLNFVAALRRDQPGRVSLALTLMVAASAVDAIGVLLLVPLLGLVGLDAGQGSVGKIGEFVADGLAGLGIPLTLASVLIAYVVLVAFKNAFEVWETSTVARLEQDFVSRLRSRLYKATVRVPWVHFSRGRRSDFIHLLTSELDRVSGATSEAPRLISLILIGGAYLVLAAVISPTLTAITGGCGLLMMILLRRRNRRVEERGSKASELGAELHAEATENLRGLKTVRSYGAERQTIRRFSDLSGRVADNWVATLREYSMTSALYGVLSAVVLAVTVFLAMEALALPTATILLVLYLFARIVPRFSGVQTTYQYLLNATPAYSNVRAMALWAEGHTPPRTAATAVSFAREIGMRDVTFRYPTKTNAIAVEGISLTVRPGEFVALVGRSGAGKSTVADLLLGLLEPSSGEVVIDGVQLTPEAGPGWRERVGYVPQRTFLLHDTVCANLEWGTPGASEGEMWEALRLARAEDFVRDLPGELDAVVGDDGALLSGGEQQRLALARALLRKPDLLLLDEATSGLDYENERDILEAIHRLDGQVTTLMITHRLQLARGADRIYVLESGSMVEAGSWGELMGRRGGTLLELLQAEASGARHRAGESVGAA